MKRLITAMHILNNFLILTLLISTCNCGGGCSGSEVAPGQGDGAAGANLNKTQIEYSINLDSSKEVKKEGNKVYYKVPMGTNVIITAKITGRQGVMINWTPNATQLSGVKTSINKDGSNTQHFHYNKSTENGKVMSESTSGNIDELVWSYTATKTESVEVFGKPHVLDPTISTNDVIHQEKIFVINWE